jgi:DNA-directed RNA polymerase sigma subunit (sigma70/sigma32)
VCRIFKELPVQLPVVIPFPPLSELAPHEEQSLAIRFRELGDVEAGQILVISHLGFVVKIAREYRGYVSLSTKNEG